MTNLALVGIIITIIVAYLWVSFELLDRIDDINIKAPWGIILKILIRIVTTPFYLIVAAICLTFIFICGIVYLVYSIISLLVTLILNAAGKK